MFALRDQIVTINILKQSIYINYNRCLSLYLLQTLVSERVMYHIL